MTYPVRARGFAQWNIPRDGGVAVLLDVTVQSAGKGGVVTVALPVEPEEQTTMTTMSRVSQRSHMIL